EPRQHLDRGRLACAVRPQKTENLALLDVERNSFHRLDALHPKPLPERLLETLNVDRLRHDSSLFESSLTPLSLSKPNAPSSDVTSTAKGAPDSISEGSAYSWSLY